MGSSCCSTAVEQLPCDHEIMGSDPTEFEFSLFCVLTHYLCLSLVCPSTGPSSRSNANEFPSKDDQLLQLQLGNKPSLMWTETAKHNICLSFQCSALAAVAQPVWHPELRSLWEDFTKQTWVWFPVASDEVGENPSRAIYDANFEVSALLPYAAYFALQTVLQGFDWSLFLIGSVLISSTYIVILNSRDIGDSQYIVHFLCYCTTRP